MIDPRLGKHFLRRLRCHAEAEAIDRAVGAELLVEHLHSAEGRRVRTFAPGPLAAVKSEADIVRMLQRHARTGSISRNDLPDEEDELAVTFDAQELPPDQTAEGARPKVKPTSRANGKPLDMARLLRAVRRTAEPLRASDVATLLLVADAIAMSDTSLEEVQAALRLPSPIITITGRVNGFEDAFLDLLGRGLVLPGTVAVCNGFELMRHNGFRFSRIHDPRWRVIVFEGGRFDADSTERIDRQLGVAAESVYPILGVAEKEDCLPEHLKQAGRLNLTCGPISMEVVRETMRVVLGEVSGGGISYRHTSVLTLSDLALAIRPGMPAGRVLELLEDLACARLKSTEEDQDGDGASGRSSDRKTAGSTTVKTGRGNPGAGSERIEPVALTGTDVDRFIPRIETLSGYGAAKDWALGLKEDLALWRAGTLAWEDMSVKALLSGPPGTGKTTFARALCNTLQVPLIVSSVATWLEPGYLGDVLKRMSAAFAEAEETKPSILFIDEIDGIGKRGTQGEWNTYWNSVVNRALELLDGAAKSDGVIVVGATNNPDVIDPALLRSGRLEKHITIPRPDTEALIGILRHHLRTDLDGVVASAPQRPSDQAEAVPAEETETEARAVAHSAQTGSDGLLSHPQPTEAIPHVEV